MGGAYRSITRTVQQSCKRHKLLRLGKFVSNANSPSTTEDPQSLYDTGLSAVHPALGSESIQTIAITGNWKRVPVELSARWEAVALEFKTLCSLVLGNQ